MDRLAEYVRHFYISLVCIVLNAGFISAQWVPLPEPISGIQHTSEGPFCNLLSLPDRIVPFSNGGIIYTTRCYFSPSSGSLGRLCFSTNDLGSVSVVRSIQNGYGTYSFDNLKSYGDSVFTWTELVSGSAAGFITTDQFKSVKSLGGGYTQETSLTPNYLYGKQSAGVLRTKRADNAATLLKNNAYKSDHSPRLDFANDSVGFMIATPATSTATSVLLRTTDFGESWQTIYTSTSGVIVDFNVNGDQVLILTESGTISKSMNHGNSWQDVPGNPGTGLTCIHAYNTSTWFIGGSNGALLKTTNSGANWSAETSNTTEAINKIYTFDDQGYFVTGTKKVFKSGTPVGISDKMAVTGKSIVMPNPSSGSFKILLSPDNHPAGNAEFTLFNLSGAAVAHGSIFSGEETAYSLSPGIYFLQIMSQTTSEFVRICIE